MVSASPNVVSAAFLAKKPRSEFVLSSRVGKLRRASRDNEAKKFFPFTTSPNTPHFDYSAYGVRRSIDDSLQRLGMDRLDIVFVHDLSTDNTFLPEDWDTLWTVAEKIPSAFWQELRSTGILHSGAAVPANKD